MCYEYPSMPIKGVKMQDNRTAEIWGPRGCWRTADFEDLRKNMVFRLREPGGELVRDDAGNTMFCAMSDPYYNKDRILTIIVRSRATILAYGEN